MSRNPALDTKVKALYAFLLKEKDYLRLIEAKDVSEVIDYLKRNPLYASYLSDLDSNTTSRTVFETAFSKILIENTKKLLHYVLQDERNFLNLIIYQRNLESLLILLRAIQKGKNIKDLIDTLAYTDSLFSRPIQELNSIDDFTSFKSLLRNTIYYRSLETYDKLDQSDLFQLEKTMERSFYDRQDKLLDKLNSKRNKELIKVIRTEVDLLNLIWIYRAKKFYNFNSEQILPFVYKGGLLVRLKDLQSLAEINDYEELLKKLRSYKPYAFLFEDSEDIDLHMDRKKRSYMNQEFRRLLFNGNALAAAYSYLRLLQDEGADITSLIEAKRYRLDKNKLKDYLSFPLEI